MPSESVFFEVWCGSYREDHEPLWVEPTAPLEILVGLAEQGLLSSGCVNGQDDYVWKLTPLGCLVGAALNKEVLASGLKEVLT